MALNTSQGTIGATAPVAGTFPANHAFYVREFIEIAKPEAVYDMFGTSRSIPKNSSNQISYNKVDKLSTLEGSPLVEGTIPPDQSFTLTRISQTVSQYGGAAKTTDRLSEESVNGLTSEFNKRIAEQAAETMNLVTRNTLTAGTNVRRFNGVGTIDTIVAAGMGFADFDAMFVGFKKEKVKTLRPQGTGSQNIDTMTTRDSFPTVIAVEGATFAESLNDAKGNSFIGVEQYASQKATWVNEHGTFKNFAFILDTESKIVANAAPTPQQINQSLVFGKGAYDVVSINNSNVEIIIKPLGSSGTADPINQLASIGWKAKKAAIIVQPTYMFRYEYSIGNV